jgi:zinc transporter ZupT
MGIMLVMIYFVIGIVLGYWGFEKLYPYFYDYILAFLAAMIWLFFCLGFIPICLCVLTFKAY